jgi:cytosine/adenosine deaminase-related metal-dependent hydrolase
MRFTVLTQDRVSGNEMITRDGDSLRVHYEYVDRGRGPSYDASYVLDAQGFVSAFEAKGKDYLGKAFEERFTLEASRATWVSSSDRGSVEVTSPALYLPIDAPPGFEALLAHASTRHEGRVRLLPEGEAHIRTLETYAVTSAIGTKTLHLVEIEGVALVPLYVWLDSDGEPFADVSTWFSIVREGWNGIVPSLIAEQERYKSARWHDLAARLRRPPPAAGVAFTHARLFDSITKRVQNDVTIVIGGNRIRLVGPSARVAVPAGAEVHDLAGRMVLPGLWDMHVHTTPETALLELASGVTTIRDLGNDVEEAVRYRREFDAGETLGPRMLLAGFVDGRGPFTGPTGVVVDSPEDARAAVSRFALNGFAQLKIYGSVKPELVPVLVHEAKTQGMRVSGHVPFGMVVDDAVNAGFDEINHVTWLIREFLVKPGDDTPDKVTTFETARRASSFDVDGAQMRGLIERLRAKNVVVDPTLSVFEMRLTSHPGELAAVAAPVADRLPATLRRSMRNGGSVPAPPGQEPMLAAYMRMLVLITRRLHDAGVTLVAGTDNMLGGIALHRELELYVEAGLSPADVLSIATIGAARVMGRDRELGAATPGRLADLVVVDGDPTKTISDIRRVTTVIKDGYVFDSGSLFEAAGLEMPSSGRDRAEVRNHR